MYTTQQHLSISDIFEDILILKNGSGALALQVAAVNFGLLSNREQMAIIYAFAQMLNSLSFSLQIVIISQRLNINSYIELLNKAQKAQTNPLLSQKIIEYKQFVQSLVKENEVLDKKFYIIIPLYNIELGLKASKESLKEKIKTILLPRRDQIIRQLNRVGLKAVQLNKKELIELFYDIYNWEVLEKPASQTINPQELAVKLKNPQQTPASQPISQPASQPTNQPATQPITPLSVAQNAKNHPFVVEELEE